MIPFIIIYNHKGPSAIHGIQMQTPPPPLYELTVLSCTLAHFKGFWDFAWANMGQIRLKIALNHLFEHPEWSRSNFRKKIFLTILGPSCDPSTCAVHGVGSNRSLKGVEGATIGWK